MTLICYHLTITNVTLYYLNHCHNSLTNSDLVYCLSHSFCQYSIPLYRLHQVHFKFILCYNNLLCFSLISSSQVSITIIHKNSSENVPAHCLYSILLPFLFQTISTIVLLLYPSLSSHFQVITKKKIGRDLPATALAFYYSYIVNTPFFPNHHYSIQANSHPVCLRTPSRPLSYHYFFFAY